MPDTVPVCIKIKSNPNNLLPHKKILTIIKRHIGCAHMAAPFEKDRIDKLTAVAAVYARKIA
jgi:hypothetical protein